MVIEQCIRYAGLAVGLMIFKNDIQYSLRRRALPWIAEG